MYMSLKDVFFMNSLFVSYGLSTLKTSFYYISGHQNLMFIYLLRESNKLIGA